MQMAASVETQDVERVEVRVDAEDPAWNVVRINQYASHPAAKADKHPKTK